MNNKIVIYTAIFGGRDNVTLPKYLPQNADFVCFTDSDIKSNIWEIRKVKPISESSVRSAKIYKVLPHKYFPEYEYSLWIDGNIELRDNVNELISTYLKDVNFAVYNHMECIDKRDCIYDEAQSLIDVKKNGKYGDLDLDKIIKQMKKYKKDGYPPHNGLIHATIMLRRHNEPDVIKVMEDWWSEIKHNSRRDQLSFNYVAWKNDFKFAYIDGDSRNNKYFKMKSHAIHGNKIKVLFIKVRRLVKKVTKI